MTDTPPVSEGGVIPTWEDLTPLTPAHVRRETGLDVPDEATGLRVHRDRVEYRPVGEPVKKLVPDERYSLFRNPTYSEIEEQKFAAEVTVTWRVGDELFAARVDLKEPCA